MSGNNCNHNPYDPSLALSKAAPGNLPKILIKLLDRIDQYFGNPNLIPSLNAANDSARQQRSERREACIQAMKAIIRFTDLTTLMVCIPGDDERTHLKHDVMLAQTGLTESRYKRAIKDLKRAGIITVTRRNKEVAEGVYEGQAAIKCLSKQLFGVFGLGAWLNYERNKASKRAKRAKRAQPKPQKRTRNNVSRAKLAMDSAQAKAAAAREVLSRKKNRLIIQLKEANPDLSWSEINALAQLQLT